MNCKIGDMAIIIGGSSIAGRIVEVYAQCPRNVNFSLPDGFPHAPCDYEWIIKFQNPVDAPIGFGRTRTAMFAAAPDRKLRPVSGLPVTEETRDEVPA